MVCIGSTIAIVCKAVAVSFFGVDIILSSFHYTHAHQRAARAWLK